MKRNTLSYLIETELEKAEVLLAAKAISNKLQQMAEQLAKMDANDVMPLGDAMRNIFGAEQAQSFEQHVSDTLRQLTEQIRDAKNSIGDQLDALDKGEPMTDIATTNPDDMFGGDDDAAPEGDAMAAPGDDAEGADMFDQQADDKPEGDMDMSDLFGGDPEEANSAGRAQKESVASTKKVLENANSDVAMTRAFAGHIREGYTVAKSLSLVAEAYATDINAVAAIVSSIKTRNK